MNPRPNVARTGSSGGFDGDCPRRPTHTAATKTADAIAILERSYILVCMLLSLKQLPSLAHPQPPGHGVCAANPGDQSGFSVPIAELPHLENSSLVRSSPHTLRSERLRRCQGPRRFALTLVSVPPAAPGRLHPASP